MDQTARADAGRAAAAAGHRLAAARAAALALAATPLRAAETRYYFDHVEIKYTDSQIDGLDGRPKGEPKTSREKRGDATALAWKVGKLQVTLNGPSGSFLTQRGFLWVPLKIAATCGFDENRARSRGREFGIVQARATHMNPKTWKISLEWDARKGGAGGHIGADTGHRPQARVPVNVAMDFRTVDLLVTRRLAEVAFVFSKKLKVYIVHGKGSNTELKFDYFKDVLKQSTFKHHDVDIDATSGRAQFFPKLFGSHIAYLSLHANPGKWVIPSGEHILPDAVQAACAAAKTKTGPRLIVVTGCETIKNGASRFAAALGIGDPKRKRAYIGYDTYVQGNSVDKYFRVFLALWRNPKPDGTQRTLEQTRAAAKALVKRMVGRKLKGSRVKFAPIDHLHPPNFIIIGDSNLKYTDL